MSVVIYARVSTGQQAEKELSIPAQLRSLRTYATERGWKIAGEFQDVASGWSLTKRPGLSAALRLARNGEVNHLIVHKADRLSRNTYQYLTIKGQLRTCGVNIVSVVERFEDNPMGEFMEHIMAAQAEFYSANLSFEVKKGLEERRRKGLWSGCVAIGYLNDDGKIRLDPARSEHLRFAFERWASGTVTSTKLADELFERGLVGRNGKRLAGTKLCGILKNVFYTGIMKTASGEYPGRHPQLVSRELFERCQEVFQQKGRRGTPRQHHEFLLAGLIRCPRCCATLVGERHVKKSKKVFRYYRCHRQFCRFCIRAAVPEEFVERDLLALKLPERLLPSLSAELKRSKRNRDERQIADVRALRQRLRGLDEDKRELARRLSQGLITDDDFTHEHRQLRESQRLVLFILATSEHEGDADPEIVGMVRLLDDLKDWNLTADCIERRRILSGLVASVDLTNQKMLIKTQWYQRLQRVRLLTTLRQKGTPN